MRISELLYTIASWLESPDNEAILLSEYDDDCMDIVVSSCVEAAALLKITAETVEELEPQEESHITPESLDGLVQIANAFDYSGDEDLKKQASVIDELLLTIASPPDAISIYKKIEDRRLEDLKKKYEQPRKDLYDCNKIADSEKAIDKSNMMENTGNTDSSLSTRYCPDHAGAQVSRIGDNIYQCELDKKTYDFSSGFTLNNGKKVPGGDVSEQTKGLDVPGYTMFDDRESRLQSS